jgi:hypothetical protein
MEENPRKEVRDMTITYPPFPTYNGNLSQMIIQMVLWVIEIPLIAIGNGLILIIGGASSSASQSLGAILYFPGAIFVQTEDSFAAYGIFAPLIASLIWGVSIIIIVFLVLKAVQIAGDEITNEE